MMLLRTFLTMALAAAGSLGLTSIAAAGPITVVVSDNTGRIATYFDAVGADAIDQDGNANAFNLNDTVLQALFPELAEGSTITSTSNFGTADPFRTLSINSTFVRESAGATQGAPTGEITYTILAYQLDFSIPVLPNKRLTSAHSGTFTNAIGAESDFQGWADPSNAGPGPAGLTPGLHGTWIATTNDPQSFASPTMGNPNPGPVFFNDADTYSLFARQEFTLDDEQRLSNSGSVRVDASLAAVPEPASMGLFGLGLAALYFVRGKK
jgi:hypothetical protein